ncbi:hypothetical protein SK803_35310 [Lentzea sp. BCCO 10_0856]|uniref:Histidine kinase-, DNA gyrase B-, and HSP90-like ATPase n=1 Tax=Lentzea miocenica TaxID=3095431 RepID=A0ABU4TBF9_9PSEU|nr:hypothetical protein [Lentzea sp. BCCO 10_0856]MDX8035505.1 hypothetical protein [Lentzea sp. BCCO 10_0856]
MPDSDQEPPISASQPDRSFADMTKPHPWSQGAIEHEGWDRLKPAQRTEEARNSTAAIVQQLAAGWEKVRPLLDEDPWFDRTFAERFAERVRWVIDLVLPGEELELTAAEVALLVAFPHLHQAFWAQEAEKVLRHGLDPAVGAFRKAEGTTDFSSFAAEHGTLHRRGARAGNTDAAAGIGWWLFHRWLVQRSDCYHTDNIAALLPAELPSPLNSVFSPARLMELLRVVQIDSAFLRRADRTTKLKPVVRVAGGTARQQTVREQLIGYLLVFAHRTAIDPTMLSRVVVNHVGIRDGLVPEEALASIMAVEWNGNRTLTLCTSCGHPATALALRAQAAMVDSVLTEIVEVVEEESVWLAPLKAMPVHAAADGVVLAAGAEHGLPPSALGHRFRLAEDRIQELLMGEQLYGTPELAIRELYQNALDACRYRDARTAYLTKTIGTPSSWSGRISFRQGADDHGRKFVECADNGIGMGDRELVDVFSRAGVRFADMPEYVEEQADWAEEGIESFPNSRFGIGVLSYFMLADEITVTTCRLDREGNPGRRLEVHIAGPGALFRVRDLGEGVEAGTVVRLWLRQTDTPLHCTELLRRILWLSDYEVTSDDMSGRQTWDPHQLSTMAPVGSDALADDARRTASRVVPTRDGKVWWCNTNGAVLADGIWAGTGLFGAVVNLARHDMPRLTIDRKSIIDIDHARVEELMRAAIPALLEAERSPLSHRWLSALADDMPRLADEICEHAVDARYQPWLVAGSEMPIEVVGCFPFDEYVLLGGGVIPPTWSDHIGAWRLEAWLQANPRPGSPNAARSVIPARPSDQILLTSGSIPSSESLRDWLPDTASVDTGHLISAALRAQRSPAEVAARLTALGYTVPVELPSHARAADLQLLGLLQPGKPPWLSPHVRVSHQHVLLAAINAGFSPRAAAERLTELGYSVLAPAQLPSEMYPADRALIQADRPPRVLRIEEPVPVPYVLIAAARTNRTPAEVAGRLAELGYRVPDLGELPDQSDGGDEFVLTAHTKWPARLYVESPVPSLHITLAAIKSDRSPAEVAARLAELGFEVPPGDVTPDQITQSDLVLTKVQTLDGLRSDGLHVQDVVAMGHVLSAALKTGQPPSQVGRRLVELGYTPPPLDLIPDEVEEDDLVLVSTAIGSDKGHGYSDPRNVWLSAGAEVSFQHIMIAAARTRRSPRDVARRLDLFGFTTPPEGVPDLDAGPDDLVLLSSALDKRPPWLTDDHPALRRTGVVLPLGHVLAAASLLGRPPEEVAARLKALGLRSETAELPSAVDPLDGRLLGRAVDLGSWQISRPAEFLWLGKSTPADRLHLLICAERTGLAPAEAARRLTALGIPVQDAVDLPISVDKIDLALLSNSPGVREPFRSVDSKFPRGQVMSAAFRTRTSPGEVLERVRKLGFALD